MRLCVSAGRANFQIRDDRFPLHRSDDARRIAIELIAPQRRLLLSFFTPRQRAVDTRSNQAQTDVACWGVAMTVATGFSVLFVVAIPIAIVAISLALTVLALVKDSYLRRKNPA
jgi:hypothetical protein